MVNIYNISINYKLKSYNMTLGSERRLQSCSGGNLSAEWSLHSSNQRRGRPSLHLLAPAGTLDLTPNFDSRRLSRLMVATQ
jgi:hypothetical protein